MITEPSFDPEAWAQAGFRERVHAGALDYVRGGMKFPIAAYVIHAVKIALYVLGWMYFAGFKPGLGSFAGFTTWIFDPAAFQKAWLWAALVETLGLGCMSGPLGMRFWPPFTASLHFLRPGTMKLAPFPKLPLLGGTRRSWLDAALYAGLLASLVHALVQPEVGRAEVVPILAFLAVCALTDKVIPLCARYEHHYAMILCFAFPESWLAGAKWVQLSIWFWAGVSKLTVAFGYVVPIMISNNPLLRSPRLRERLFRAFPDDLTPSPLSRRMAHGGTFLELAAPLTLLFVTGAGPLLYLGLFWAVMLHGFIISNMPVGAVFEWNLVSLYAAFFLFLGHPAASPFAIESPLLAALLAVNCFIVPLIGQFLPDRISFLVAMRYYAGNWPWNAWFFRGDSHRKMDGLPRAMPLLIDVQEKFQTAAEIAQSNSGALAFRTMHLQGRMLGRLIPTALGGADFRDFRCVDGELVSASVLGWNFGEGHSSNERLLELIQSECRYEEGELRVLCVESQPLLGSSLAYRIYDAKTGLLEEGSVTLDELARRKPWDLG